MTVSTKSFRFVRQKNSQTRCGHEFRHTSVAHVSMFGGDLFWHCNLRHERRIFASRFICLSALYWDNLASQIGSWVEAMTSHDWTLASIATLRQLWDAGLSTAEIGRRMGISKNAVVGKAHRLHLTPRAAPNRAILAKAWTDEEDAFLTRVYGGFMTAAEIGARMGRSKSAIAHRAANLGLSAGRRASQRSRGMVPRPAARARQELPCSVQRAASPLRPSAATISGVSSSAVERRAASLPVENLPEAVAETPPPRVFSGTQCCHPVGDRTCDEPVQANARGLKSPYCPEHFALIYAAPPAKSATNPPHAGWLKNRLAMRAHG
jgi:GcrA cell cycle regulator